MAENEGEKSNPSGVLANKNRSKLADDNWEEIPIAAVEASRIEILDKVKELLIVLAKAGS